MKQIFTGIAISFLIVLLAYIFSSNSNARREHVFVDDCHGQETPETCDSIFCCARATSKFLPILKEEMKLMREELVPPGAIVHMSTTTHNVNIYVKADGKTVGNVHSGADYTGSVYKNLFHALGFTEEQWKQKKKAPLPDLRGRFLLGSSKEYPMRVEGGEETCKLTVAHMPRHQHFGWGERYEGWEFGERGPQNHRGNDKFDDDNYLYGTSFEGGDKPHNNMPPYYSMTAFVKV